MTEDERAAHPGPFYMIEVLYHDYEQPEICRAVFDNLLWNEVRQYRETFFSAGVAVSRSPTLCEIIAPGDIRRVFVHLQKSFKK